MVAPTRTPARFAPAESVHWTDAGRELVIFDRLTGQYHSLNGSAAAIWRALGDGQSAEAVINVLAERFSADREAMAVDVRTFLTRALAAGLIAEVE